MPLAGTSMYVERRSPFSYNYVNVNVQGGNIHLDGWNCFRAMNIFLERNLHPGRKQVS